MASLYRRPPGRIVGSSVGAAFGLVFVIANAGAVGRPADVALRLLALVGFATCLVGVVRRARQSPRVSPEQPRLGRGYWAVVAGEVAIILVGRYILATALGRPGAVLPWVTLVVGVHFFALAEVLHARLYHVVGLLVTGCALAGFALANSAGGATGATSAVAVAAGVCPGFLLLAASLWGLRPPRRKPIVAPAPDAEESSRSDGSGAVG